MTQSEELGSEEDEAASDPWRDAVERFQAEGDFTPLYASIQNWLRKVIHMRIGPQGLDLLDRDDVQQEVLFEIQRSMKGFCYRGKSMFFHWLRTRMEWKFTDLFRRLGSNRTRPLSKPADTFSLQESSLPDGLEIAARRECVEAVASTVSELPELQAELIRMRYCDEFSVRSAAKMLEIPESTARYQLAQAETVLAIRLARYGR